MKIKMLTLNYARATVLEAVLLSLTAAAAFAQEITGTPGSPSAGVAPSALGESKHAENR